MKQDTIKFINTYLRKPSEPRLTKEQLQEVGNPEKGAYNLKWQVGVRKMFFGNEPFNRLKS